jgi:hypothetical protein
MDICQIFPFVLCFLLLLDFPIVVPVLFMGVESPISLNTTKQSSQENDDWKALGTGKSYLTWKLADYCIGKDDVPLTFSTVLK